MFYQKLLLNENNNFNTVFSYFHILLGSKKAYDIGLIYGFYKAPDYKLSDSKDYKVVDFTYHITDRWSLTSGFTSARFDYFDDIRSNVYKALTEDTRPNTQEFDAHTYAMTRLFQCLQSEIVKLLKISVL